MNKYDQPPELIRLRDGGFGWFERALSPVEQFQKELAELDVALRDSPTRQPVLAKLERLIALTSPGSLLGLTPSECDVARDMLRRKVAQWRGAIGDRVEEIEDRLTGLGFEEE